MPGSPPMPNGAVSLPTVGAQPTADAPTDGPPLPPMGQHNPYGGSSAGDLDDDFVIDLSDVQAGGRDYIGVGRHLLYCTNVETGVAGSGNRKLIFTYVVASGEYEGKKAQSHVAMIRTQDWKIDQHLRALGVVTDDHKKPTLGEIKRKAQNVMVVGEFVPGTYNNRPSVDFSAVYPPDEVGIRTGATIDQARRGEANIS